MATIRERPRARGGTTFTVRWRIDGRGGAKEESEVFNSRKEAEAFKSLVDLQGQHWPPGWVRGEGWVQQAPDKGKDRPFSEWAHRYVDRLTGIDSRTRHDYHRDVKLHFIPCLPDAATVGGLTADHIGDWVRIQEDGLRDPADPESWKRKPAAPKSIANRHGLLYCIMQAAVEAEPPIRASNPCRRTRLPRIDDGIEDEMVFLERDEWQRLRAELAVICGGDSLDLVDLLISTGLRWGEATALQVRDLTLNGSTPTLRVQRAWKRQDDNTFQLGPPKTKKARRTLALNPTLVEMLRRRVVAKGPEGFVFTTKLGKPWRHSNFYHRRWQPALKAAQAKGFPKAPRPHDLRHTHVSWLIANRIPLPAIQARLGHESIVTTVDRYGHLERSLDADIAAAVEAAMADAPGPGLRLVDRVG